MVQGNMGVGVSPPISFPSPSFPPPSDHCIQSVSAKAQWLSGYWMLWNQGWNLKSLNSGGLWGKDKGLTWMPIDEIGLIEGDQKSTGEPSSFFFLDRGGLWGHAGMGVRVQFALQFGSPFVSPLPSKVAGSSTGQQRRRRFHCSSPEGHEWKVNSASLHYT